MVFLKDSPSTSVSWLPFAAGSPPPWESKVVRGLCLELHLPKGHERQLTQAQGSLTTLSALVFLSQHAGCVHRVLSAPGNRPQLAFQSRRTLSSKDITCLSHRQHDTLSSAHVVQFLSRSMRPHFQMRSGSQFHPLQKGQELLKVLNSNVMESNGPRLKKEAIQIGH